MALLTDTIRSGSDAPVLCIAFWIVISNLTLRYFLLLCPLSYPKTSVRSEVLTAVVMSSSAFWDITYCTAVISQN
jgi:hypothetical protein